ncbi:uncharacterized protein Tgap1l6 isoform X1 [Rattus norvegicus]|uniref:uncharacterized protein Tgap1l6 isoform X1 n=1 Tax=Rattus norvegicus TaxID=10116 RepID=UPI002FD83AFB
MEMIEEEDVGKENQAMVCQGAVVFRRGWKRNKRYLTLLSDVLVVSSKLNKKKFKVKHVIPLTYLWIGDETDIFRTDNSPASKTIYLYWPMGNAVVTFRSMEETIWWNFFLQRSIRDAKKQNKIDLSLQISTEDIARCDTPLYVKATNFDTVNDIMSKLLPMMRKHNIEDYQLWFCPRPGEAPRALQGNEYPHDIIMINIQKNFSSRDLRHFTSFPSLPGLIMKYLNSDAQGQFILRPRNSARSQQQKNMKEKTLKKQRTSTSSWWHRSCEPHPDQVCTTPKVNNRGKLFGRELSSICKDGNLPLAILDMLSLLKREGPTTEGVFIIHPSITMCQTIKDKLDSEEEVDMNKLSVHVVSWIFKDFLQNIEGSLMTSKLYDEWIAVTKKVDDEEKLAAVQSLLDKLPSANAVLLRQIFQILYEIKSNSSVNEMSSYNLSVGIAPCLLFMPSYCNNGGTNDIPIKISLVTFMIENTPKIFGEDVVAVSYETSLTHPPGAKSSCSPDTSANTRNVKQTNRGLSSCPTERTCPPDYNALPGSPAAPLPCEDILDSEKSEGNVYTNQAIPLLSLPQAPKKCLFGKSLVRIFEGKSLPTPIFDMFSIIAEKGQDSDHIFNTVSEISHWSLRDRIENDEHINWQEEDVLVIASVLMDFISNIKGSLLTSDLYEDWLTVMDEGTLFGRITAIQRLTRQMPEQNFLLLQYVICVLVMISDSSMNNLDSHTLSLRIALSVLCGQPASDALYGDSASRKISVIKMMIDHYLEIFGNDNLFSKHIDERSDDLKMYIDLIFSKGKSPIMKKVIVGPNGTTCSNDEKVNISNAALQEEFPTGSEKHEHDVSTIPSVLSPNRLRPRKKSLFGQPLTSIFEDNKLPTSILDMISIIAAKGQSSDQLFRTISENSQCSLRDKIDTEQPINWNDECVLVVASVLKDFITNIDGSLLTYNLYENWLTVPEEETLAGQIIAIQSLLQQIPDPNFILLKYLICLLVIIKDSPMNKLDTKRLSIRLAPHVLWGWTSSDSLFGKVVSRKISLMEIMIDNYIQIFENDNRYCIHNEKRSAVINKSADIINSDVKSTIMNKIIGGLNRKTCYNNEI